MHAIDVRCRRENETSNSQDRHFVRPTIHSQFIYRRRVRCRPKRKHTNLSTTLTSGTFTAIENSLLMDLVRDTRYLIKKPDP